MKTKILNAIAIMLTIAVLAVFSGCSSGDSSGSGAIGTSTLTGSFIDSHVTGLSYKATPSGKSGTTDQHGSYNFVAGDTVEFSLGGISLGSLTGRADPVSPIDLFQGADVNDQRVINIARLLQSLDDDGDITHRITINQATIDALIAQLAIKFPGVAPADIDLASLDPADLQDVLGNTVGAGNVVSEQDAINHLSTTLYGGLQPPIPDINGSVLACTPDSSASIDAEDYNASQVIPRNISSKSTGDLNRQNPASKNTIKRLSAIVPGESTDGNTTGTDVHPLIVVYTQQIVGDYEMGDGSADIGDPTHVDGIFLAKSLDNGDTWKNTTISDTTAESSISVDWNGTQISYPGHAQKPKIAVNGNNIVVAWHDKYCKKSNPFNLVKADENVPDVNATYPDDYFFINGTQRSIDYAEAADGSYIDGGFIAPNGKAVFEVPFSCVWTSRGIFNPVDKNITWHEPMQLTTGVRDSNHIWIEASAAGFAMAWQEDTEGLRSGKGAGPGVGWSGATTNHGSDIWYSSLKMEDFADANVSTEDSSKLISTNNFHYPVRITDNETCSTDDPKPYCNYLCDTYGSTTLETGNSQEATIQRCNTYDVDMLENTQVALNGDTGASRSALKILVTDQNESVVILGYEETKGLSDNETSDDETNIELEGKVVLFESFKFDAIDDFNASDPATIQNVAMPLVSAGDIINVKAPDMNDTSNMIYENARRLVIGTQVDSCDADKYTFAIMYKQSTDTQGASSDMYIRLNEGFTYDSFVTQDDRNVTNVSAQEPIVVDDINDYNVTWSITNLSDYSYNNLNDNTFSPRISLRGNDIYTGFVYTPNDAKTTQGNMPSNFHTHIYMDLAGGWQGPVNVSQVVKGAATVVDPRMSVTPKGNVLSLLPSDQSNPNVMFVTWGEIDWIDPNDKDLGKAESNIYYKRALSDGANWVWDANKSIVANKEGAIIEEKEVVSFTTPDGKTLYNVWVQEEEHYTESDHFSGLDSWFGRVDYNISK